MSHAADQPLVFYPAYCFSASPTFNVWVKLTAAGIQALNTRRGFEGQGIYFYRNHPIQWIQVTGLVVDFEPNDLFWLFQVDDGSGALVEVVLPRKKAATAPFARSGEAISLAPPGKIGVSALGNEINIDKVDVGMMIKVKGGIREFREVKQIALERLFYVRDTAAEVQAWDAAIAQYSTILSRPWHLTTSQERSLEAKVHRRIRKAGSGRHRTGKPKDEVLEYKPRTVLVPARSSHHSKPDPSDRS